MSITWKRSLMKKAAGSSWVADDYLIVIDVSNKSESSFGLCTVGGSGAGAGELVWVYLSSFVSMLEKY